jgi:hypothetical protein
MVGSNPTVMAGLAPAIRRGTVLRQMAGSSPAMTMRRWYGLSVSSSTGRPPLAVVNSQRQVALARPT